MVRSKFNSSCKWAAWRMALATAALIMVVACGGGGGSSSPSTSTGDVSALALPGRIQLSNVDQNAVARNSRTVYRAASRGAYNDAGTDYSNAQKHAWLKDTDALDMINTILGVCSETSYANFINQGPYKALVRDDGDSQQSQSGNTTTATTTETLMEIIVDVTRASNTDPMVIKVWLYVNGPNSQPMLVRGYFEVTRGVSAEYPFGAMTAHFKGNVINQDGSEGLEVMQMALGVSAQNGNVVIENVDDEGITGTWESHRKVRVQANADVTQGNAYVYNQETMNNGGENYLPSPTVSQIAFNESYFKETELGQTPLVYAKNQLTHRIFRYKLFDAETGAETTLNSGFPIQFETASGTQNGYVGYYGLWTNNNITLAHGSQVSDMDGNSYTVFRSAGKLTKHTASQMPLSDLTGVELSKWENGTDSIVAWNGTNFIKIGYRDQNAGQIVYYAEGDPNITTVTFMEWEGAWCESLKSYLRIGSLYADTDFDPMTPVAPPTNDSILYYHIDQTLSPSEVTNLTLYTWSFTLDLPITQTIVNDAQTSQSAYWGHETEKTFHFVASDMMLYDESETNEVTLSNLTVPQGSFLQYGYNVSPLTTQRYYNNQAPYIYEAENADVYYSWNTGTDQWNQYVTVMDNSGNFATFDPPLSFAYTHSTANDANGDSTYSGKKFRLEYDGFSLNMPWSFNPESGEWEPQINLADGTQLEDRNGNLYVIKGVEESLIMSEVQDASSITFDNEETVGAPTLAYDSAQTDLVGAIPTNVELKVIKGEVIE